ncbi:hypothetical protein EPN18_00205 [bacterium]|nr:MAG: hypothetical protein EPN18_00205 [bacterium]
MIDVKAASLGFSFTVAAVYIVCALAFYFFGSAALELFNTWAHGVDLSRIAVSSPRTTVGFLPAL